MFSYVPLTWMRRPQLELWGGRPLSVVVRVKAYSARSEWLRGEEERSSPVFGLREKRSARGPVGTETQRRTVRCLPSITHSLACLIPHSF